MPESVWPIVVKWLESATNRCVLRRPEGATGADTLQGLEGMDESTMLGAMAKNAGSIVVQDWLVVLGAGGGGWPSIIDVNLALPSSGATVVAVDLLGGTFAINGGGLPDADIGEVVHLAVDTLRWTSFDMPYEDFVHWTFNGDLDTFYKRVRWNNWRGMTHHLEPGQGVTAYPFPWTAEGQGDDVMRSGSPLLDVYTTFRGFADVD